MILRCAMFGFHNSEVLYFLFYAMQFFLPFFMMHFFYKVANELAGMKNGYTLAPHSDRSDYF